MDSLKEYVLGARVRLQRTIVAKDLPYPCDGTVVRADARGILVRLDSSEEILCEPTMLVRIT